MSKFKVGNRVKHKNWPGYVFTLTEPTQWHGKPTWAAVSNHGDEVMHFDPQYLTLVNLLDWEDAPEGCTHQLTVDYTQSPWLRVVGRCVEYWSDRGKWVPYSHRVDEDSPSRHCRPSNWVARPVKEPEQPAPKTTGIEVCKLAHKQGYRVQIGSTASGNWVDLCDNPRWDANDDAYRIHPQDVPFFLTWYNGEYLKTTTTKAPEPASKARPHAELIKAWADGAEIEYKAPSGEWIYIAFPSFQTYVQYRIKPEPTPVAYKVPRAVFEKSVRRSESKFKARY